MRMNNRDERNTQTHRFFTVFAVSVLLHVLLVAGSIYLQYVAGLNRSRLSTIEVSLVTLPGPGSPESVDMSDAMPLPPEPEPVQEPEAPQPEVVETPPPPAKPEKRKVDNTVPEKIVRKSVQEKKSSVEERLKKLEQQVEEAQPSDFERQLALLQQKVSKGPPSDRNTRTGPGRFGPGDGEYGAPMSPYERYVVAIQTIIRQNWSFTPQLVGEMGAVKAYVAMTIQPGGTVSDITFDRKSSSQYFDDTVLKAIKKSSPLPPVPGDVSGNALIVRFAFTPQGIE
ncbi:MAG: TonB family protein [Chlorobium phaeobacteroides]|nr:TonB family protein [Chlorobium phaeobacteroides]